MKINLFDNNFRFMNSKVGYDSLSYCKPEKMEWVRDNIDWPGATVFADELCFSHYVDSVKTDFKVAWLLEPPGIKNTASGIQRVQHKFDMILSYLPIEMLGVDKSKFVCLPSAGSWIQPQEKHEKTRDVSIIASGKRDTVGHRLRHEIIDMHRDRMDLYGYGYKPIESKTEGLLPYRFSVIIENEKYPMFFSEKLVDCMLCRTIPIYWGASRVSEIFDNRGILSFDSKDDIDGFLKNATPDLYTSLIDSIEYNYDAALRYARIDDIMHDVILERMNTKLKGK